MKTINKPPLTPLVRGEQKGSQIYFPLTRGTKGVSSQNKKAFTLVELIIVITILAILATIAFVSFQ
jgi:prepilin-type N-terminal cleavage/methylation domain-containing protein